MFDWADCDSVLVQAQAINRIFSRTDLDATGADLFGFVDSCLAAEDDGARVELWRRVGLAVSLDIESGGQC